MKKQNIVVYGNCQGKVLFDFINSSSNITEKYEIFYHFVEMENTQRDDWQRQIDAADIVLAQDVRNWVSYPFREQAEGKTLVRYPLVTFASLWPFDSAQGQSDTVALATNQSIPLHLRFDYQDALLTKMRSAIPDQEDRYQSYKKLEYGRRINFKRFLQAEISRLENIDRSYDLNLTDYILSNIQKKRLFHTITHPTVDLMEQFAASTCKLSGLPSSFSTREIPDHAAGYQVPVHPKIASDLEIQWANEETRYNFKGRQLTFEAYYRAYIYLYG